jgi:hypothetical protein
LLRIENITLAVKEEPSVSAAVLLQSKSRGSKADEGTLTNETKDLGFEGKNKFNMHQLDEKVRNNTR